VADRVWIFPAGSIRDPEHPTVAELQLGIEVTDAFNWEEGCDDE
jgi:hypothetical protein